VDARKQGGTIKPITLIADQGAAKELRDEWEGARLMLRRMGRHVRGAFVRIPQLGLAHAVYNLPLLLACDVLKQALVKAKAHYHFKGSTLGQLMAGARSVPAISWVDHAALLTAIEHRNAIAHDGKLFAPETCLADMTAIETQLIAWSIVKGDAPNLEDAINDR
jgi:hypothetical protein